MFNMEANLTKVMTAYECGRCRATPYIPVRLRTCRHIVCSRCVAIRKKGLCPKCKMEYEERDVERNPAFFKRMYGHLEVMANQPTFTIDEALGEVGLHPTTPTTSMSADEGPQLVTIVADVHRDAVAPATPSTSRPTRIAGHQGTDCNAVSIVESSSVLNNNIVQLAVGLHPTTPTTSMSADEGPQLLTIVADVHRDAVAPATPSTSRPTRIAGHQGTDCNAVSIVESSSVLNNNISKYQQKQVSKFDMPCVVNVYRMQLPTEEEEEEDQGSSLMEVEDMQLDGVPMWTEKNWACNAKGQHALHIACKRGNADAVRRLIAQGADVNCVDYANWTPLHEAVDNNRLECARLLLKAGCLPSVPAFNYDTPLHQAADGEQEEMCMLLLHYGADPHALNDANKPPENISTLIVDEPVEHIRPKMFFVVTTIANHKGRGMTPHQRSVLDHFIGTEEGMEYHVVDNDFKEFFSVKVIVALLRAAPILYRKDKEDIMAARTLAFIHKLPVEIRIAYTRAVRNQLQRFPGLFAGMFIHVPLTPKCYIVHDVVFSRQDIEAVISFGSGQVIQRAPSESTTAGKNAPAYHCRHIDALRICSHYIVYDAYNPADWTYNLPQLRHISAAWLLECAYNFEILPLE